MTKYLQLMTFQWASDDRYSLSMLASRQSLLFMLVLMLFLWDQSDVFNEPCKLNMNLFYWGVTVEKFPSFSLFGGHVSDGRESCKCVRAWGISVGGQRGAGCRLKLVNPSVCVNRASNNPRSPPWLLWDYKGHRKSSSCLPGFILSWETSVHDNCSNLSGNRERTSGRS